jgi:LmbE family N-acetylglucosaminyl deacetylase
MNKKNILVVVAHPDDEVIGPGGTIIKHTNNGDNVYLLVLSGGRSSRNESDIENVYGKTLDELKKSLKLLGINSYEWLDFPDNQFDTVSLLDIVKKVSSVIDRIKPEIVITHHFGDINVDHQLTSKAVIIACRPTENKCVKDVYMFETLSSTEVGNNMPGNVFMPNIFVDITNEIDQKMKAMSCYASELKDFPHPRSLEAIKTNARLWGAKNYLNYAEAFHCYRGIKNGL